MEKIVKYTLISTIAMSLWAIIWNPNSSVNPYNKWGKMSPTQFYEVKDTTDTLTYPFNDYDGNPYSQGNSSPLYLGNPANVNSSEFYDPATNEYIFSDSIGSFEYRPSRSMTLQEYAQFDFDRNIRNYWRQRARAESFSTQSSRFHPRLRVNSKLFETIFGSNVIDIKPQGSAELIFGMNINKTENPALPENLRTNYSFEFDEKIQMGVVGKIGEKLDLQINYNTEATFDFENNVKLGYNGDDDDIIKKIEAGNVSLPLNGTLITGSQSLFGFKTEMQFGKLSVTSIFSQQKGESSVIEIEGGAQVSNFELSAGEYEANRHFFLSNYFRDTYNEALAALPIIRSGISITKVEVWITNKAGSFEESRNMLAMTDLGENPENIYNGGSVTGLLPGHIYPDNGQNSLYEQISGLGDGIRNFYSITSTMSPLSYESGIDFEKVESARKLSSSEFTINNNLGYVSLNQALNSDEILAVAYEYQDAAGNVYKVGEFSDGHINAPNTLILKLLKGINLSPTSPIWDLMMKNIYAIGAYQINNDEFKLDVLYHSDQTGNKVNYVPGGAINGSNLLGVLNLDNLNSSGDAGPDGRFDFLESRTINSSNGRVIFPVLEPFGDYLREKIDDESAADRYVFDALYDSTQSKARQMAEKNKFFLKGSYKSSAGSEIMLNAMNIPEGSVRVTAGGTVLAEGSQYIVDYTLGRVTILDHSLLESGKPIRISLESNALFNIGTKTMLGAHLDYNFSENFRLGATILHLNERPLTNKVSIGSEPISNTIWGFDGAYATEMPRATYFVDRFMLPFSNTKEISRISIEGEFAHLIPGTSKTIGEGGVSYIDDFEGTKTTIDLRNQSAWYISSTPQGQTSGLFPEGELHNNLEYGFNRAKIAWYQIQPDMVRSNGSAPGHLSGDLDQLSNHLVREVFETDIFPNKESTTGYPQTISVLNLAYYPQDRGPYNYSTDNLNLDGSLANPETRWGGLMRKLQTNDFEASNIEYLEFWMMDPFVYNESANGVGQEAALYFNMGNISEDVLRDSRKSFENGLPTAGEGDLLDTTEWGVVSVLPLLTESFDNNPNNRALQDVGLDGLDDEDEQTFFATQFLDIIQAQYGAGSPVYIGLLNDPSSDNYHFYKGGDYDQVELPILGRYKKFNGLEGNSPSDEQNPESYPTLGSQLPDIEDINKDNTLNESESYYQYKVNITPTEMEIGKNFITDMVVDRSERKNGQTTEVKWYQFKVPLADYERVVGPISDFKSIRFMRMFMRGCTDSLVLRFATLDLVRGEWRKYGLIQEGTEGLQSSPGQTDNYGSLEISAVNIEENSDKSPVNYVLPPGVNRVIDPANTQLRQLNEQAISLKVIDLADGFSQAAYKNVQIDMRQYQKIKMNVHAEALNTAPNLEDGDLVGFIRLGTDYQENYYEYEVPLTLTNAGVYSNDSDADRNLVWPTQNNIEIDQNTLMYVKQERNNMMRQSNATMTLTKIFEMRDGKNRVRIIGNPNLSNIRTIMIGVRNNGQTNNPYNGDDVFNDGRIFTDDGMTKSGEIWFNELRLTDFNEKGGWAANLRMQTQLADFATVSLAGQTSTPGFGSIEKKVNDRSKEYFYSYDLATNLQLGKLLPQKAGLKLPMYFGFSESWTNPEFNPLDPDIPLEVSLDNPDYTEADKDSIRHLVQDYTMRKSINFTNVKIDPRAARAAANPAPAPSKASPGPPGARGGNRAVASPMPWDISNWAFSYAYNEIYSRNINTQYDTRKEHIGSINYNFTTRPKNVTPFRNIKFLSNKNLKLIRDFNFYYMPNQLSFRTEMSRRFRETKYRNVDNPGVPEYDMEPSYEQDWWWNRNYDLKYNLSKNLKFDFVANNRARIDEMKAQGKIDEEFYDNNRDTTWQNIMNFGRTTNYEHRFSLKWKLPINQLPFLNWVNTTASYSGGYQWQTTPMLTDSVDLGNTISNSNQKDISVQLNFKQIYKKVKYLNNVARRYGQGRKPPKKMETVTHEKTMKLRAGKASSIVHKMGTEDVTIKVVDEKGIPIRGDLEIVSENKVRFTTDKDIDKAKISLIGRREKREPIMKILGEFTLNMMMGLKMASLTYSETNGTIMPGYKPRTKALGLETNGGAYAPGFPFIAGFQDDDFARMAGNDYNWLSTDTLVNSPYTMTHNTSLNFKATIEPFMGLKIDLMANRSFSENMTEYYMADENGNFDAKNRRLGGNFSMSFNSFATSFWSIDEDNNYSSEAFDNFKEYRRTISERLATDRGGSLPDGTIYDQNATNIDPNTGEVLNDYKNGYSPLSQEILIPAFLAAYTDQSPSGVGLTVFPTLPMLNWRIQYDGLSKIELIKKHFQKVVISHAYRSSYNVGSYTSDPRIDHSQIGQSGYSFARDEQSGLFIPEHQITGISISEQFAPLFNVDATHISGVSARIEYKKSRELALNFASNQVSETFSKELVIGAGYKLANISLFFKDMRGKQKKSSNDIDFRFDFSYRNTSNILRSLLDDPNTDNVTSLTNGMNTYSIKFSADYVLNDNFNLRLFYDHNINQPKISLSFPTSNIKFGLSLRFTLVPK